MVRYAAAYGVVSVARLVDAALPTAAREGRR